MERGEIEGMKDIIKDQAKLFIKALRLRDEASELFEESPLINGIEYDVMEGLIKVTTSQLIGAKEYKFNFNELLG